MPELQEAEGPIRPAGPSAAPDSPDGPDSGPDGPDGPAEILLAILRESLSAPDLDMDSRFYAHGGDSLIAVRVVNTARAQGIPISLRDLMVQQTVRGMLGAPSVLEAMAGRAAAEAARPDGATAFELLAPEDRALIPAGVQDALPASALQIGMLYLCESSQDPLLYHSMDGWEVCAPFEENALRTALGTLAGRHPALRTSFDFGGLSEPAQLVWADAGPELSVERAERAGQCEELRDRWCDQQLAAPVDWSVPSLLRCHVVAGPDSFHVVLAAHHTVVDGWSLSRLAVELMTLYSTATGGSDVPLPALSPDVQRDFIAAERAAAASPAAAGHWLGQADAEPLLFDASQHDRIPNADQRCELDLDPALVRSLNGVARMLGVSVKSIALAAHARALGTWTRREHDVVTGVVFNTRPESPGSDVATGLFLNTLPVRFATVDDTWTGLIKAASDAEREGAPHQAFPQAHVSERLGRPAFDVTFNFMNFHTYRELDRLTSAPTRGWWRRGKPSFPFHVNLEITGTEGQIRVGFDSAYVARPSVEAYAHTLRRALKALVANPVSPAGQPTVERGE